MMSPVCVLFLVLPLVSAQTFHLGPCPNPRVQSNFTLQRYLGRWYEIEKLPCIYEKEKCVEGNFFVMSDGSTRVHFSQIVNNEVETMEGVVHQDMDEPAKLGISYFFLFDRDPWWVLATDYSTVSVVYSCYDFLHIFHMNFAWIISRTRSLPPDVVREAKMVFLQNKIDISKMIVSDHTGCGDA